MLLGDGDGFVKCACGYRHWGVYGAAGLLVADPERGVLLQRRAWWVHHGGTWAVPGGAVRSTETAREAAMREAAEEAAIPEEALELTSASVDDHGTWRYTTVLASTRLPLESVAGSAESAQLQWVRPDEVQGFRLHRDFAEAWPGLRAQLERRLVLVVDAANVLATGSGGGSRDRAGATGHLADQLVALSQAGMSAQYAGLTAERQQWWWPSIVLVVEGEARAVAPRDGLDLVSAHRDGQSAVVDAAARAQEGNSADHVVVVTTNERLRARARELGARCLQPAHLLRAIDALHGK